MLAPAVQPRAWAAAVAPLGSSVLASAGPPRRAELPRCQVPRSAPRWGLSPGLRAQASSHLETALPQDLPPRVSVSVFQWSARLRRLPPKGQSDYERAQKDAKSHFSAPQFGLVLFRPVVIFSWRIVHTPERIVMAPSKKTLPGAMQPFRNFWQCRYRHVASDSLECPDLPR